MKFIELIVYEPQQQATFSYPTVPNNNNFNVALILIHDKNS